MTTLDFLVTPIYLIAFLVMFYFLRPKLTNSRTRKFYFPALLVKIFGALALGFIYQFYYGGGDTFGYTTFGASYIWSAFLDNPSVAFDLIFGDNQLTGSNFSYAIRMWYFDDSPAYFVVRVAGFISLFTFNCYSTIALVFASISFISSWLMYSVLSKMYPNISHSLAYALFFIPSTIFWGSGVLKDTLTLSALALATYSIINIFTLKVRIKRSILLLVICFYIIYIIKIYILLCFLPAAIIWVILINVKEIRSQVLRLLVAPVIILFSVAISAAGVVWLGNSNSKYSIENVLKTAEITARDNSMWTVRKEGSGYNLGDYDFSPSGVARKFVPAVWVTLFRPYIWEAKNAVVLIAALESFVMLIFTVYILFRNGLVTFFRLLLSEPILIFCTIFTITFAFAIGISSGNFGSLVRYKIPILPFFVMSLFIFQYSTKRIRLSKKV